jgi:hypothetical protein
LEEHGKTFDNITDRAQTPPPITRMKSAGKGAQDHQASDLPYCRRAHDPLYREKYAQNLKREFPRIPFHADFCSGRPGARR